MNTKSLLVASVAALMGPSLPTFSDFPDLGTLLGKLETQTPAVKKARQVLNDWSEQNEANEKGREK